MVHESVVFAPMRTLVTAFGRFTAAFVTLAMLTSSIAMAAYVCPVVADGLTMTTGMASDAFAPCHDEQRPVHCAEHHTGDKQALEHSGTVPGLALPAVTSVQLILPTALSAWQTLATPATPAGFSSQAPPFLRTQRLRI